MPLKTSIYLADATLALRRGMDDLQEPLSRRVNQIADRYSEILRRDTRATLRLFSVPEQSAILTACWEWETDPAGAIPAGIAACVEDSTPAELGLDSESEQDALISKLGKLSTAQQICLVEWIEGERILAKASEAEQEG